MDGKIEFREPRQSVGQMINGVILFRQGTVAACVGDFQLETEEDFLGGLHLHEPELAVLDVAATAVGIHAEFGVDQIAMVFHQPVDAVRVAAFFVGGQRQDHVARGFEAFALQAKKSGDQNGVVAFHILRAASVRSSRPARGR